MTNSENYYRKDIDGLRAVAVLCVIGFHLAPNVIRGGFIGVDIFFVISGYLITSIIQRELTRNSFSFIEFYGRRLKRIAPALILVIFCCYIFGWFSLTANEFLLLGKHIASASSFTSNFVLWSETGYFDNFTDQKILLHLWSLGVEEQFYLIWPFILWLAFKFKINLLFTTAVIFFLSISYSLYLIGVDPQAAFYSPLGRFWEILMGALIYLGSTHQTLKKHTSNLSSNLRAGVGLIFILLGLCFINKTSAFPGLWALSPTIGAALVISANPICAINRFFLSSQIMVGIGLISYPLYLWHWPILAFARIIEGQTPSYFVRFFLILITFALSIATYFILEKSVRKSNKNKAIIISLISILISTLLIGLITFFKDGFAARNNKFSNIFFISPDGDFPDGLKIFSLGGKSYGNGFINSNLKEVTLYIGDSNMAMYYPRINQLIKESPSTVNSAIFLMDYDCMPIPITRNHEYQCLLPQWSLEILDNQKNIDRVVLGSQWFWHLTGNSGAYVIRDGNELPIKTGNSAYYSALSSFDSYLKQLKERRANVYLILSIPIGRQLDPRYMAVRNIRNFPDILSVRAEGIKRQEIEKNFGLIRNDLINLAKKNNIKIIDPISYLCDENYCNSLSETGIPIYKDDRHLNHNYVRHEIDYIDKTLKK